MTREQVYCLTLYVRRWQLGRQAVVTAGCGVLWLVTPLRLYDVPARHGVQGVLWPLVPVLFAAFLPTVLATGADVQERTVPRPARLRALTTACVGLLVLALLGCGTLDPAVAVRNTALLVGLAFTSAWLLPAAVAWAPAVVVPMLMWLVGTKPRGEVEAWALLLLPGEVARAWYAWVVALAFLVLGVSGYVGKGPRV